MEGLLRWNERSGCAAIEKGVFEVAIVVIIGESASTAVFEMIHLYFTYTVP